METPERRHGRRSDVFIVNFEQSSHLILVFLLLRYRLFQSNTHVLYPAS